MSEHHGSGEHGSTHDDDLQALVGGMGVAVVLGLLLGLLLGWPLLGGSTLQNILTGMAIGTVVGLVIGFATAWNGSAMQSNRHQQTEATPLWGLVPSALIGIAVAPLLGAVTALVCGQILAGDMQLAQFGQGGLVGLIIGPLLGIAAWQSAFWLPSLR